MQWDLWYFPGWTTATHCSGVYLVLTCNVCKGFKTALRGSFSRLIDTLALLLWYASCIGCPFSKGYILRSCCMCTTVFKVHLRCICKTLSICTHLVMLDLGHWEILLVLQSHLPRKCTGIGAFLFWALNYGTPYHCTFVNYVGLFKKLLKTHLFPKV